MPESVQTLKTKTVSGLWIAGDGGFLFQLGRARMLVDLAVNFFAAQKTLHRTVILSSVAGLVAGEERVVNIAFDPVGFPADGVHHRMAVAPEFGIFRFQPFDQC